MKKNRLLKLMNISPIQMREIADTVAEVEKRLPERLPLRLYTKAIHMPL